MAFLTQEQVRAVRLKGSEKVMLERLGVEILMIPVPASRAFEIRQRRATTTDEMEMFSFMLQAACATAAGDLFTKEDAEQMLDVLTLGEASDLVQRVSEHLAAQGKSKASRVSETSSSASVSPSAGPTPTT